MTDGNAPVAFWNRSQRETKLRYTLKWPNKINKLFSLELLCGLLVGVASTALVAWYFLSPSGSSPTVVSPSAVCDVTPLEEETESDSDTAIMRFVAYGDMDSDDDVPCGMLPDIRIAVIHRYFHARVLDAWWEAVGGGELGIVGSIPPGVRVPTTAERLSAVAEQPIRTTTTDYSTGVVRFDRFAKGAEFITIVSTGPEGTVKLPITVHPESSTDYSFCAISPDDVIIGCYDNISGLRLSANDYYTVYIYLTHGHAVIETGNSDRYQRYLDGTGSTGAPAIITFQATLGDDIEPSRPYNDVDVIIVDDAHVNVWWTNVFDNGSNELNARYLRVDSKVIAHDWVHVVTTGPDGLAETALPPGDYLICAWANPTRCIYHNLTSGDHKFFVNFGGGGNTLGITKKVEAKPVEPDCDSPFHGLKLGALERHLIECAEEAEGR